MFHVYDKSSVESFSMETSHDSCDPAHTEMFNLLEVRYLTANVQISFKREICRVEEMQI